MISREGTIPLYSRAKIIVGCKLSPRYIDGSEYKHGKLLLLGYDEGKYYQIEEGRQIPVHRFIK